MKRATVEQFMDAVVLDRAKAKAMLVQDSTLLNGRTLHDETALHFLAVEGYVEDVQFLAEAGADIDAVNQFGHTALLDVANLGNAEVAAVLLNHHANPNAQSTTHDNVLHTAVRSGNPALVELLLAAGARHDYVTDLDETIWDAIGQNASHRAEMEAVLKKHNVASNPRTNS
jgi:ankyrin repeat protein